MHVHADMYARTCEWMCVRVCAPAPWCGSGEVTMGPRVVSHTDNLAPSPPSMPGPGVSQPHLLRDTGTAIPAGAVGEEQGLWLRAAHGLTPCVPGRHPPPAPLPHHPSLGPQLRVSAAVGASHLAWLASGEGRCPLRSHAGIQGVQWAVVGQAGWPLILLGL